MSYIYIYILTIYASLSKASLYNDSFVLNAVEGVSMLFHSNAIISLSCRVQSQQAVIVSVLQQNVDSKYTVPNLHNLAHSEIIFQLCVQYIQLHSSKALHHGIFPQAVD